MRDATHIMMNKLMPFGISIIALTFAGATMAAGPVGLSEHEFQQLVKPENLSRLRDAQVIETPIRPIIDPDSLRAEDAPYRYPSTLEIGNSPRRVIKGAAMDQLKSVLANSSNFHQLFGSSGLGPTVELYFKNQNSPNLKLSICPRCMTVHWHYGNDIHADFWAEPGRDALRKALGEVFPDDPDILMALRYEQAVHDRWMAAMPSSLRPLWPSFNPRNHDDTSFQNALRQEFPSPTPQIRALYAWFGSGEKSWAKKPAYEVAPRLLLEEYSAAKLFEAALSQPLSDAQLEGAAIFFVSWRKDPVRHQKFSAFPPDLRKVLLRHCLRSADVVKLDLGKQAYQDLP